MALMRRQPQGGLSPANAAGRHGGHGPSCPGWEWFGVKWSGFIWLLFWFHIWFLPTQPWWFNQSSSLFGCRSKKVQLKFGMGYGNVTIATNWLCVTMCGFTLNYTDALNGFSMFFQPDIGIGQLFRNDIEAWPIEAFSEDERFQSSASEPSVGLSLLSLPSEAFPRWLAVVMGGYTCEHDYGPQFRLEKNSQSVWSQTIRFGVDPTLFVNPGALEPTNFMAGLGLFRIRFPFFSSLEPAQRTKLWPWFLNVGHHWTKLTKWQNTSALAWRNWTQAPNVGSAHIRAIFLIRLGLGSERTSRSSKEGAWGPAGLPHRDSHFPHRKRSEEPSPWHTHL